jgi:glutamyl aminopeptidase
MASNSFFFLDNKYNALFPQSIMDTWTLQMGFPLVSVERNSTEVTATQSRFLMASGNNSYEGMPTSPFGYKWYIPLSYRTDKPYHGVTHVWMNLSDGKYTKYPL